MTREARVIVAVVGMGLSVFGCSSNGRRRAGCETSKDGGASSDVTAIQGVISTFVAAYNAGDTKRIMDAYSADLVYMPEGIGTVEGKDAVNSTEDFLRTTFSRYTGHLVVHVDEIVACGDIAFDRGTLIVTLTPRGDGKVKTFSRRFLEIFRKETDGKWRVVRVMNNAVP